MAKMSKVLGLVTPYSFDGSIINIEKAIQYLKKIGYRYMLYADRNFHALFYFLDACKKNGIAPVVGIRLDEDIVYYAKNSRELRALIELYNNGEVEKIKSNFESVEIVKLLAHPGEEKYLKAWLKLKKIEDLNVLNESLIVDLSKPTNNCFSKIEPADNFNFGVQSLVRPERGFFEKLLKSEKEHYERLKKEIDVIKEKRFEDYIWTVKKIVDVATENKIQIGPGRGSAVGSYLLYRIGVTKVNPIKYNLLFERFLHKYREDFPDVDIDIEDFERKKLIELLKDRIGYVYNISTFSSVPEKILAQFPKEISERLKVLPLQPSIHAAGVIISTEKLNLPRVPKTDVLEFDMYALQSLGYIKFDLLGLKTLSIYKELKALPFTNFPNDENTYKMLSKGFTNQVFQLDSKIGKKIVLKLKPESLQDLYNAISLNRPGPLRSGLIDKFIEFRKTGTKLTNYEILEETYGIPLYQEQVMKIAMELAGMDVLQADEIRKAIAKKDSNNETFKNLIEKLEEKYGREGKILAEMILNFGEYAFNKSHAVAYSYITYAMAYYKANYPKEFYRAYLKHDSSIIQDAVMELRNIGFKVTLPYMEQENEYIFSIPLYCIAGITPKMEEIIKKNEPYNSLADFLEKNPTFTFSTIEKLIKAGYFDSIYPSRRSAIYELRNLRSGIDPDLKKLGNQIFGKVVQDENVKTEEDWERCQMEHDVLGCSISFPTKCENKLVRYAFAYSTEQNYPVHIAVKAGFGTDGESVFKIHLSDGEYTLTFPDRTIEGFKKVLYVVDFEQELEDANPEWESVYIKNIKKTITGKRPKYDFRVKFV